MICRSNIFMTKWPNLHESMCRTGRSKDCRQQVVVEGLAIATGFFFSFFFKSLINLIMGLPFLYIWIIVPGIHVILTKVFSVSQNRIRSVTQKIWRKVLKHYEGTFIKLHKNISRCLIYWIFNRFCGAQGSSLQLHAVILTKCHLKWKF